MVLLEVLLLVVARNPQRTCQAPPWLPAPSLSLPLGTSPPCPGGSSPFSPKHLRRRPMNAVSPYENDTAGPAGRLSVQVAMDTHGGVTP